MKKGMIFSVGEGGANPTVLVITEVYPTYARAQPHPKYAGGEIRLHEKALQLPQLPETAAP